eukprot:TRINITY_DN31916_c0_g1_i1.p1 TRINITY_DN31916_c0_g1~~TRINITY_DN31916_c0_g1_i1.p1  ORF type:complete len:242 (-),score=42.93 TRINITY_DN31916_c0_g1_i1:77-772(-)
MARRRISTQPFTALSQRSHRHAVAPPLASAAFELRGSSRSASTTGTPVLHKEAPLGCASLPDDAMSGEWAYESSMSYFITVDDSGKYQFDEMSASRGVHHKGLLQRQGEWYQGDLLNQDGRLVGSIRLRLDPQRRAMISQCRAPGENWGRETVAYAPGAESELPQMNLRSNITQIVVLGTLCFASVMLLQELTWRNSVRPLFQALGLGSYADDLEQAYKDAKKRWQSGSEE